MRRGRFSHKLKLAKILVYCLQGPGRSNGSDIYNCFYYILSITDPSAVCYPFHPRVTAVARKRSRSFCQKCRWQVTAKHAYTLRMWLCKKRHGAWLYGVHRTCAETAAVSCCTSHASAVT